MRVCMFNSCYFPAISIVSACVCPPHVCENICIREYERVGIWRDYVCMRVVLRRLRALQMVLLPYEAIIPVCAESPISKWRGF